MAFKIDAKIKKWGAIAASAVALITFGSQIIRPVAFIAGLTTTKQLEAVEYAVEKGDSIHFHDNQVIHQELHSIQHQMDTSFKALQNTMSRGFCASAPEKFQECKKLFNNQGR